MNKKEIYQKPEMNMIYMEVEGVMAVSGKPGASKNPSGVGGFDPTNQTYDNFWGEF